MAMESSTSVMESLLEKLRLDEPWVPPRSWDSLPSQAGAPSQPPSQSSSPLYTTSTLSEPSLVRLAMNALQGVESALISIEKLSALLCYSSADRSSHRIQSLWTRSSSTVVIGNLLTSIGQFGCIIFLLRRFVNYFTNPDLGGKLEEDSKIDSCDERKFSMCNLTLINQAFAISVGKIVDGYVSALNTLSASVSIRRLLNTKDGCLTNIGHSELTLLEVHLHTTGLRTQMEALGNLCNVNHLTIDFPVLSLEDLRTKSNSEFSEFPRSGALLSFLYAQLKVADPGHSALLKFLFLQSYEPYCDFIRSWIYDGSISDPYCEFVVECVSDLSIHASGDTGVATGLPLPTIRVRDGVSVPCFLEDCLIPLCRSGQQLQVIMKLLELSNNVGTCVAHENILPSLVGLTSAYPWFAFPLTFDKGTIERMVGVRTSYYQQMVEKIEGILTKFDFSFRQAASLRLVNNPKKNLNQEATSIAGENLFAPLTDRRNENTPDTIVNSEVFSIMNDDSYAEDLLESSECSSFSEMSEEQNEAEKLIFTSDTLEPSYLSALEFSSSLSTNNTIQNLYGSETSCCEENFSCKVNWNSGYAPSDKETHHLSSEQKFSRTPEIQISSREYDLGLFDGRISGRGKHDSKFHSPDCGLELRMGNYGLSNTDLDFSDNASKINGSDKDDHPTVTRESLKATNLQLSNLTYDSTFFSMNPILNRGSFFNVRTILGDRGPVNHMNSCFDFTSVQHPLNTLAVKLAGPHVPKFGTEVPFKNETPAAADTKNHLALEDYNEIITDNNTKLHNVSSPLCKESNEEQLMHRNISGGSSWESLLDGYGNIVDRPISDHRMNLVTRADMPLDFVIKKCVLDEVYLHYKYLSELTIKLLIEGFKLQEHLQSLRCYHFMELGDWADLFIMSLWQRKWHVSEVDKRIPEIQGILELAVRRSSCERDPNKDRLYVYLKGEGIRHLSASPVIGIHSFDYLGLGYRIDWPVSIILTPAALKIYSDIFNFLVQVKLAVFSLSDVWSSLKGYRLEQHKGEVCQISLVTETRHKLNHFVSMLQQYVQSQLSQVTWYRFLQSLTHKVCCPNKLRFKQFFSFYCYFISALR
ncbi:hypothetical protein ACS0TY_007910 [Phlomoides rotata]